MKRNCVEVIPIGEPSFQETQEAINKTIALKEDDGWHLVDMTEFSSEKCLIIIFEKQFEDDDCEDDDGESDDRQNDN